MTVIASIVMTDQVQIYITYRLNEFDMKVERKREREREHEHEHEIWSAIVMIRPQETNPS